MPHESSAAVIPGLEQTDYRRLSCALSDAELLGRSNGYQAVKIAANLLVWAGLWTVVLFLGNSWYQLLLGVAFAFVSVQTGFLAHDIGHGQISSSRRVNKLLGYFHANLLVGLSFGWWVQKHNRHHGHPNDVDVDPDTMISLLAFSDEQARGKRGFARFVTRRQAYFFVPLLLLEGTHIIVAGFKWLLTTRGRGHRLEVVLVSAHFVLVLTLLSWVMSPLHLVAFLAVQMSVTGLYAGMVFAPNHKGMAMPKKGERIDYVRRQVLTARNVRPHPVTDFVYGGLNYQVEHHLFPTVARNRLRKVRAVVRDFCASNGIAYHEVGMLRAFQEVFAELHRLGALARDSDDGARRSRPAVMAGGIVDAGPTSP